MFLKHPKWATPCLFPEPWRLQVVLCPNSAKGKSANPFGVNFQEKWNSTLLEFPKAAGDVRGQVVQRIGAGQERSRGQERSEISTCPDLAGPWGELVVATVGRRLFLITALAAGWPWCTGGDGGCTWLSALGASSRLPRQRDAQSELRPPPAPAAPIEVGVPAMPGLAAIPRPHGGGERT